ncbi:MAG: DUF1028 domain-containing protein [Candidatus Dormibacteria bacterium]
MTYSIVARDPDSGELGVAVESHWFSVGTVVTWAQAGVGAVATQAFAEPGYAPQGLALMRAGVDAQTALSALLAADQERERRQVAFINASGAVAVHTGGSCIADAGHITGAAVSVQANMMRTPDVWPAMLRAYESATGPLAERLLLALEAGEAAGGDVRGRQSAAMLVVSATSSGQPWRDRLVDLRVDDSPQPLAELRRLLAVHTAYHHMEAAEERQISGDLDGALDEYSRARALAGGNDEAAFWQAVLLADADRADEARPIFSAIAAREPGWAELLRGLPAAGMLRNGDVAVQRLLGGATSTLR